MPRSFIPILIIICAFVAIPPILGEFLPLKLPTAKLVAHNPARPPSDFTFTQGSARTLTLDDFRGTFILVNIWATWCRPCQEEMASLNHLALLFVNKNIKVVPISDTDEVACNAFSPLHNFGTFGLRSSMPKVSAGLLMYRGASKDSVSLEVLLVHPGGPFWKNKDDGAWTIPKGEVDSGEGLLAAAIREFNEETGLTPEAPFVALGQIKQKSGKIVHAWAFQGDCDPSKIRSNTFVVEWPPKSGRRQAFPEIDRAGFFVLPAARRKMLPSELPLLDRLPLVINLVIGDK